MEYFRIPDVQQTETQLVQSGVGHIALGKVIQEDGIDRISKELKVH